MDLIWNDDDCLIDSKTGLEIADQEVLATEWIKLEGIRRSLLFVDADRRLEKILIQMEWIQARFKEQFYLLDDVEELFDLLGLRFLPEEKDVSFDIPSGGSIRRLSDTLGFLVQEPSSVPLWALKVHPYNALIYGDSEDVGDLVSLISESRWIKRLTINLKGEVIGGNRRLLALRELDWKEPVPVEILRLSPEDEIQRLVLDNASREKNVEQKCREAEVYANIPGWLQKQRTILNKTGKSKKNELKAREILAQKVGIGSGYSYDKAKQVLDFCAAHPMSADFLKDVLNNKSIDQAFKEMRQIESKLRFVYRYVGPPTEDYYRFPVVEGTELVVARASHVENPMEMIMRVRGQEKSYISLERKYLEIIGEDQSIQILPEVEVKETPRAIEKSKESPAVAVPETKFSVGQRVKGHRGVATIVSVENKRAKIRWADGIEVFCDLKLLTPVDDGLKGKFKPLEKICWIAAPHKRGTLLMWKDTHWVVREEDTRQEVPVQAEDVEYPPHFLEGDEVIFAFRDKSSGFIQEVVPSDNGWMCKVLRDDGKKETIHESHLERNPNKKFACKFKAGDWISDGNSWAIIEFVQEQEKSLSVHYLGIGECLAPLEGHGIIRFSDPVYDKVKKVSLDPKKPPKCLRYLKTGDLVAPNYYRAKFGTIKGFDKGEFKIQFEGDEHTSSFKDERLTLLQPFGLGLKVGDSVEIKREAPLPLSCTQLSGKTGVIKAIARTCASVQFDHDPDLHCVFSSWLKKKQKTLSECTSNTEFQETWENSTNQMELTLELWRNYQKLKTSWNAKYFETKHKEEADGQLTIEKEFNEPPDPDDFATTEEFEAAWDAWHKESTDDQILGAWEREADA
jgi:hypothetical protein